MSGYLERMTRAVLRPSDTLRPLAGSVFSPPRRRDEGVEFPRAEEFVSRSQPSTIADSPSDFSGESIPDAAPASTPFAANDRPGMSPLMPAAPTPPVQPTPSRREPLPAAVLSPAIADATPSPTPLLNLPDSASNPRRPAGTVPQAKAGELIAAPPSTRPDLLTSPRFSPPTQPTGDRPIQDFQPPRQPFPSPLLPLSAARQQPAPPPGPSPVTVSPKADPPANAAQVTPFTSRRQQPPPARPQPSREPDEIHIHIGRIEVTAAPSVSSTHPAPGPVLRKGPSLEDYLKRSPGRRQ